MLASTESSLRRQRTCRVCEPAIKLASDTLRLRDRALTKSLELLEPEPPALLESMVVCVARRALLSQIQRQNREGNWKRFLKVAFSLLEACKAVDASRLGAINSPMPRIRRSIGRTQGARDNVGGARLTLGKVICIEPGGTKRAS